MNGSASQTTSEEKHLRPLTDILIVATPIIVLGVIGNVIGLDTLVGGAVINLGYVLAIIFGGLILHRQGSGWRKIGLGKPASWFRTILPGVAALLDQ